MMIKFSDDATDATFAGVIGGGVIEWTVDIDHENDGYPHEQVVILDVGEAEFVVCESNEFGAPIRNATWHVPLDGLRSITVL